jgi:hypothetical protein
MRSKEPDWETGDIELRFEDEMICIDATPKGLGRLIGFCAELLDQREDNHTHLEDYGVLTKDSLIGAIARFTPGTPVYRGFKEPDWETGDIELRFEDEVVCIHAAPRGLGRLMGFCAELLDPRRDDRLRLEDHEVLTNDSLMGAVARFTPNTPGMCDR